MRAVLAAIALSVAAGAAAQAPDVAWPREVKASDGTQITVYQPQLERWADSNLSGRSAVAVTKPGEKEPHYGVIELAARTQVDKSSDLVTLSSVRIVKSSFPGASKEETDGYLAAMRGSVTRTEWPVSAQALQANLAIAQAQSKQKALPVKNDPPRILFRTAPSYLVVIDGKPALRQPKETDLKRVVNTTALMLFDEPKSTYYLWALGRWWEAKAPEGPWQPSAAPGSAERAKEALKGQFEEHDGKTQDGKPLFDARAVPEIVVATQPTELLQSQGEPKFSPIPGTQLLYMTNSSNDIVMELGSQSYYALISGRWFSAKSLSGPWGFAPSKSLPPDFAKIPEGHPMGDVLASVAGTPQAQEAAIANQIPQTATVQRDVQPTAPAYDGGKPQWKAIEGTPLSYAVNTGLPVIRVDDKTYYMVQNGVWFSATAAPGPWAVAATVPAVIYSIPTSSPLHYVTYVRVYGSTSTTVFVGYTPGYYGTVVSSDGVVVYGTGYYYPPYIGPYYWYPPPYTYGYGVGFTAGFFFGFVFAPPIYGGCCWGGPPMVIHHSNVTINNSYNRWGGKSTSITGPGGRNLQTSQVGNTTFANGSGSNNVYAGRDGNVYRRDDSGDWQKYQGKGQGWEDMQRPQGGERPSQLPAERPQQRPAGGESVNSLDRQHQSRDAGAQRAQQYRS